MIVTSQEKGTGKHGGKKEIILAQLSDLNL